MANDHPLARTFYTVFDKETGEILRSGQCAAADVDLQTGGRPTLGVIRGARGDDIEQKAVLPSNGAKPYLRQRGAADIATRRPKLAPAIEAIDQADVLVEALRAKGIDLTKADLTAAAETLQARRKATAKG